MFQSVAFDLSASRPPGPGGGFVTRRGKYFELGDYPDKAFSLNEQEADAAIQAFREAPINLEHTPTVLDGKLGTVVRLWREGQDLLAEYAIPQWLQEATHGEPLRISSEWDRESKTPVAAALVLSPRVRDAVMMAAFGAGHCQDEGVLSPDAAGKETRLMGLLGRFSAFLRREGLVEEPPAGENEPAPQAPADFRESPEYRFMTARMQEQEAEITRMRERFAEEEARAAHSSHVAEITELVRSGRLTAGEAEQWIGVAKQYPAAFAAVLATLQARQPLAQFAEPGNTQRIVPEPEAAGEKLVELTRERAKNTGEKVEAAFSAVCREHPALAAAHAAAAPRSGI